MRFVCQVCGYVYDDSKEKTPFSALPDDWTCPLCGASKADFQPEQTPAEPSTSVPECMQEDLQKLSVGQLAAVCSNLSRGCEKQYKPREAELFRQLAAFFSGIVPPADDARAEKLASMLQEDISGYPSLRACADEESDRGSARSCVWGEKVTRMLSSLVNRYLREGEKMLADTDIWLCTVCGFVYIGDAPPELCPVCLVPAWKFDKIEGRSGR
ncbi:MAG: rubredoxin [Solobacterium sp.]|nr:rubredoxin [Solobacterium sp.]